MIKTEVLVDKITVNAIVFFVKRLIDSNVFSELERLIAGAMNFDISGEEKKAHVMAALKSLGGAVAPIIAATAGWALNLALEAIVAKYRISE